MSIKFSAVVDGKTYTDPALFEAEVQASGKVGKWAPTGKQLRRSTWRMPARRAFEERTGLMVGAEMTITPYGGDRLPITGQVWCLAKNRCAWIATERGFFLVDSRGYVTPENRGAVMGRVA